MKNLIVLTLGILVINEVGLRAQDIKNSQWRGYVEQMGDSVYLRFQNDSMSISSRTEEFVRSVVKFSKDTVQIVDVSGRNPCNANSVGKYVYSIKNRVLMFSRIADDCQPRSQLEMFRFDYVSVAPSKVR